MKSKVIRFERFSWLALIILMWAVFYLSFFIRRGSEQPAGWLALFYALIFTGIQFIVHTSIAKRLQGQPLPTVSIVRGFIYVGSVFYGFLFVLLIHVLVVLTPGSLSESFFQQIALLFSAVMDTLFHGQAPAFFTVDWAMAHFMPFLAILVTVGMLAFGIALIVSYLETLQKDRMVNETRIRMLQAQMKPHFLFNLLNTIAAEIRRDAEKAEKLVITLSDFLRTNMDIISRNSIELHQELTLVHQYLQLQQARFGPKLQFQIHNNDNCSAFQVPPLLLQPLVENAIQHGWQNRTRKFHVRITCQKKGNFLYLTVEDDGEGMELGSQREFPPQGHALSNLQSRLKAWYGEKARFSFRSQKGKGTMVEIRIPIH